MAVVTAGITATWGTTALGEITELKWVQGGGLPQGRGGTAHVGTSSPFYNTAYTASQIRPWSLDLGTIEVSHLSASALGYTTQYGRKATLAIGGTARDSRQTAVVVTVNLTTKAICQTLDLGAKVNDVWRYKSTFRIVQE